MGKRTNCNRDNAAASTPTKSLPLRQAAERGLLNVEEAAYQLGLRPSTIRAWLARRILPRVSCGRAVRIPAQAVQEFIDMNTIPARDDRR
jgi:excisionase family DNA binding protein